MDLLTGFLLVFGMCVMLASLLAAGYVLLNKQQATESQALLSAEDLEKLSGDLNAAENAVQYSNVLNARIGYDSGTVIKTAALAGSDCQTLCAGSAGCEGFQISGTNSCDLLANVSGTWGFSETGWNVFTAPIKVPQQVFGAPSQGEISGKDVTAAPAPAVYTKHECSKQCHGTSGCKSFSVSPTGGCKLKTALNAGDASIYASGDFQSFFLKDVKHSSGWNWKTPAPSPSPA